MQIDISSTWAAIYIMGFTLLVPMAMLLIGFWLRGKCIKPIVIDTRGDILKEEKPDKTIDTGMMERSPMETLWGD